MVMDHSAAWQSTAGETPYPPDALRRHDTTHQYPGPHPLSPRSGVSPAHGGVASVSGMTVTVRAGSGVIAPTSGVWAAGEGGYTVTWDATELVLSPAHATLARTDRLVARVLDGPVDGSGDRGCELVILTGTPGGSAPAVSPGELSLATYAVAAASSTAVQTLSALYEVALGGILPVTSAADLPTEGLYSGLAAYAQTEQALYVAHGGVWQPVGSRRGYQFSQTVRFTSSGTFTKASYPGLRAVRVMCQGGGGAGGGAETTTSTQASSGSGGQGGNYAEKWILAATLGTSETVTVGAGGVGVSAGNGGAGGTSSFGVHCSAGGGDGGLVAPAGTSGIGINGTSNTTASGDLTIPGGVGHSSIGWGDDGPGAIARGMSGEGGVARLGYGGRGRSGGSSMTGGAGTGYGGGGGGSSNANAQSAIAGGNGAPGVVIVEVYV